MHRQNVLAQHRFSASDSGMARFLTTLAISFAFLTDLFLQIRGEAKFVQLGSYNLRPEDITVVALVFALVSRVDVGRFGLPRVLLSLVLLLAAFNLLRGVSQNAFAALFDFRSTAVLLFFLAVIFARWGTLRPLEYLGFPMVSASIVHILLFGIRLVEPHAFSDPNSEFVDDLMEGRIINAGTAIFLGAAAAFFLSQGSRTSLNGFRRVAFWALAGICLVVVLMSRQRTATTGVIVGLSVFFVLHPTMLGVKRAPRLLVAIVASALLILVVATGNVLDLLPSEYRDSALERRTLDFRLEVWTEALKAYSQWDFWWQAFGRPIGVPLILQLEHVEWRYSVHSTYVGTLMSYGIVGALLWATLLLLALFAALRPRHGRAKFDLEPAVAVCWLVIYFIYGYSYEWRNGVGVFIGMALIPLIRYNDTAVRDNET